MNIKPRVTLAVDLTHTFGVPATLSQLGEVMTAADYFAGRCREILARTVPEGNHIEVIAELDYNRPLLTIEVRLNDPDNEPF